jgi:DNA-binding response OmpR family regulator
MLVEDEAGPRESLRLLLESNGYEVRAAATAAEAMDLVARYPVPPRLIIAAYWLSEGMTGVGLIRNLREATGWASSAIV